MGSRGIDLKPYYEDESVAIYNADCRDVLPTLDKVDLVLTDPPYGEVTHKGARTRTGLNGSAENESLVDFDSVTPDYLRSVFESVNCGGWWVSTMEWTHLANLEQSPPSGWKFVRMGIWVKPNGAPQFTGDRPAQGWEAVGIFHPSETPMTWNGGGRRAVWTENAVSGDHPTEKPSGLFNSLCALFSDSGDTILDPFMGSGTTLRAAKDLNRKAIGIEIDERYCEIAANRMAQLVMSL